MTPKQEAALRQAREALKESHPEAYRHTIAAIDEALAHAPSVREQPAQPKERADYAKGFVDGFAECVKQTQPAQQEPVVWMYINRSTHETAFQKQMRSFVDHSQWKEVPLYSESLANHEFQCVCGAVWCGDEMVHLPDKRPTATKRKWQGLTDEEILQTLDLVAYDTQAFDFAYRIEAKLKEKNT